MDSAEMGKINNSSSDLGPSEANAGGGSLAGICNETSGFKLEKDNECLLFQFDVVCI